MKRILIIYIFLLLSVQGIFAQDIELPQVTTIVTGDTEEADAQALPDFEDVLKPSRDGKVIEPELPEIDDSENIEIDGIPEPEYKKSFFVEGLIGGGYPLFLRGNISVFQPLGDNPFRISFNHDTAFCYGNYSVTDNYSDSLTEIEAEKTIKKNNFLFEGKVSYKKYSDGLQGRVIYNNQIISFLNQDTYKAELSSSYEFSNGLLAGLNTQALFYNRYAEQQCSFIPKLSYADLSPQLFLKWRGNGFEAGLSADYDYTMGLDKAMLFKNSHRADFKVMFQWQNDFIRLYADASAVIGNTIKEKPVIVPFTAGLDFSIPVSFSDSCFLILLEGGIDSYKNEICSLEEKYRFTRLITNPGESSDWYGKASFTLPVKKFFTGKACVEYRKTAYNNGTLQPDYNSNDCIYSYTEKERQLLITDFQLEYKFKDFGIRGSWHSNWLDLPVLENKHKVTVALNYLSPKAFLGVDFSASMNIDQDFDVPVLNAQGFINIKPAVSLIISVKDIIKLYKGESRLYAGGYVARGGAAEILMKFSF